MDQCSAESIGNTSLSEAVILLLFLGCLRKEAQVHNRETEWHVVVAISRSSRDAFRNQIAACLKLPIRAPAMDIFQMIEGKLQDARDPSNIQVIVKEGPDCKM